MRNEISRIGSLALVLVFGPLAASAQEFNVDNGHHYEVVAADGISWEDARSAVALLPDFKGVSGHLATITSEEEDLFIDTLRLASGSNQGGGFADSELWVGGFQEACMTPAAGCGWEWINDDGPFPGDNGQTTYANWGSGEPNDAGTGESHLAVGIFDTFTWNDEGNVTGIYGYVVEYDTEIIIVEVEECVGGDGCELELPGTMLVLPQSTETTVLKPEITVQSFEFEDDFDTRCGMKPLILFGGDNPMPDLIIPTWLCGSPKFLILAIDSDDLSIPSGTVFVENETQAEDVLPDNFYSCDSPNIEASSDLRHQDVVTWQSTNVTHMVEHRFQTHADNLGGEFSRLAGPVDDDSGYASGSMGEYTNGCGSSRARVRGLSYYGIGFHIHPAGTADLTSPDTILFEFIRLIRYKLAVLQFSVVVESKPPVLSRNDFRQIKKQVKQAIKQMDIGDFNAALTHMENFMRLVEGADYKPSVINPNPNGEHLSRGDNIIFMLKEKSSLP